MAIKFHMLLNIPEYRIEVFYQELGQLIRVLKTIKY